LSQTVDPVLIAQVPDAASCNQQGEVRKKHSYPEEYELEFFKSMEERNMDHLSEKVQKSDQVGFHLTRTYKLDGETPWDH